MTDLAGVYTYHNDLSRDGKVYVGTRGSNTGNTTPAVGELDIYALKL